MVNLQTDAMIDAGEHGGAEKATVCRRSVPITIFILDWLYPLLCAYKRLNGQVRVNHKIDLLRMTAIEKLASRPPQARNAIG